MIPRFKRHVRARVLDDEHVALLGEGPHELIPGRLHPLLIPLIDGRRSVEEIARALNGQALLPDVTFGVEILVESGWVTYDLPRSPQAVAAAVDACLRAHPRMCGADLDLVALPEYLSDLAHARAAAGGAWLAFKPDPDGLWVGPLVDPPRTPCWTCVTTRLRANQPWRALPELDQAARAEDLDAASDEVPREHAALRELLESLDADGWEALDESLYTWDAAAGRCCAARAARHRSSWG